MCRDEAGRHRRTASRRDRDGRGTARTGGRRCGQRTSVADHPGGRCCGQRTSVADHPGGRRCGPTTSVADHPGGCGRQQHPHRLAAHRSAGGPAGRRARSTVNRAGVRHSVVRSAPLPMALGATDPRHRRRHPSVGRPDDVRAGRDRSPDGPEPGRPLPCSPPLRPVDDRLLPARSAATRARRAAVSAAGRRAGSVASGWRRAPARRAAGSARAPATRCCAMVDRSCHRARHRSSRHGGAATMTRDDPIEARPGTLGPATRKNDESPRLAGALYEESGGVLLSQGVYPQVPSALAGLTAVFGMGTGVTPPLWPPEISCQRGSPRGLQSKHERSSNQALGRLVPVG